MAFSYIRADRDQLFLMPADMREWLPEGHLAWFVLDVVARLDTRALHVAHPNDGSGRAAYDPDVMLALLIYAYCTGSRSSRRIEQACHTDVAYRVICANQVPDHSTIARFRQAHDRFAQELFVGALALCAQAGLAKVGTVAIDGTKMAAYASMNANATLAQVQAEVAAMFADAAAKDALDDCLFGEGTGDELPEALADRRSRAARLDLAQRQLQQAKVAQAEREAKANGTADRVEAEARAKGKSPKGRPPRDRAVARAEAALAKAEAEAAARREHADKAAAKRGYFVRPAPAEYVIVTRAKDTLARALANASKIRPYDRQPSHHGEPKVNLTDLDARVMRSRTGYLVGYNAQAAVNEAGVVLAAEVTQNAADSTQLVPMLGALAANLAAAGADEVVGTALFDAGYWSEANATAPGPDRLIGTANSRKLKEMAHAQGYRSGPAPEDARPIQAMEHRLCTKEGSDLYAKRSVIVEPVFGQHKEVRGFRRLSRRGLKAAEGEWKLINTTHNLLKLFRSSSSPLLSPA
jgi:transposase